MVSLPVFPVRSIGALLFGAMVFFPACGDDAPSGPDPAAFCETWETETGQIPENSDAWGDYAEAFEDLVVLAPAEIQSEMETLAAATRKVADGSQHFDDIYLEDGASKAYDAYSAWTSDHCSDGPYFPGG